MKGKKLNMDMVARKALVLSLSKSLIEYGAAETTIARAKYIRPKFERLITIARKRDLSARRKLMQKLRDKKVVSRLLDDVAPLFDKRNGGYTRIVRTSVRKGDNAQLAKVSLVESLSELKKEQSVKKISEDNELIKGSHAKKVKESMKDSREEKKMSKGTTKKVNVKESSKDKKEK